MTPRSYAYATGYGPRPVARDYATGLVLTTPAKAFKAETGMVPSHLYAGTTKDLGTVGHDLVLQGSAVQGVVADGIKNNRISNLMLQFGATNLDAADFTDPDVADFDGAPQMMTAIARVATAPGSNSSLGGKRMVSSPFHGIEWWIDASGFINARYQTATQNVTQTLATDHTGAWFGVAYRDRQIAGFVDLVSTVGGTDSDAIASAATTGSASAIPTVMAYGQQRLNSAVIDYAMIAICEGAQVEAVNPETVLANLAAAMIA